MLHRHLQRLHACSPALPQATPAASTCGVWTRWTAPPTLRTATHPLRSAWRCCATPRPSHPQVLPREGRLGGAARPSQSASGFLNRGLLLAFPAACCAVIEFGGGPGSWVTRTYTASRNGGAFCNGKPIQERTPCRPPLPRTCRRGQPLLRHAPVAACSCSRLISWLYPALHLPPTNTQIPTHRHPHTDTTHTPPFTCLHPLLPPGQQDAQPDQVAAGHWVWVRARRVLGGQHEAVPALHGRHPGRAAPGVGRRGHVPRGQRCAGGGADVHACRTCVCGLVAACVLATPGWPGTCRPLPDPTSGCSVCHAVLCCAVLCCAVLCRHG